MQSLLKTAAGNAAIHTGRYEMNWLGAVIIVAACSVIGIKKACSLGNTEKCYAALISMLEIAKGEICTRRAPMDEVFTVLEEGAAKQVRPFVSAAAAQLTALGEHSFAEIWCGCADKYLQQLSPASLAAVKSLGGSLGRYDAEMQCAAIERCMAVLSQEQQIFSSNLSVNKRMYIGIGSGTGLIIAIMLL